MKGPDSGSLHSGNVKHQLTSREVYSIASRGRVRIRALRYYYSSSYACAWDRTSMSLGPHTYFPP